MSETNPLEIDPIAINSMVNQLYGQGNTTTYGGTPISAQQFKELNDKAVAGDVTAKDFLRAYNEKASSLTSAAPSTTGSSVVSDHIDTNQITSAVNDVYANPPKEKTGAVRGVLENIFNTAKTGGKSLAGQFDTLYGIVPQVIGAGVQGLTRAIGEPGSITYGTAGLPGSEGPNAQIDKNYQMVRTLPMSAYTPEEAEKIGQTVTSATDQPLGKLFGITKEAAYQHPFGSEAKALGEQINHMFNVLGMTPEQISEKTGINAADIRGLVTLGSTAIPALAETKLAQAVIKPVVQEAQLVGGAIKKGVKAITPMPVQRTIGNVVEAIAPGTTNMPPVMPKGLSKEEAQTQFEARGGNIKQNVDELNKQYEEQKATPTETPSLQQPIVNETGQTVGTTDLGTSKPTTTNAPFKPVEYAENGLPLDEQFARAKAMEKVLGSDHLVDMAALEGKGKERATNYQASKSDTEIGNFYTNKFADEQNRLKNYADKQAKDTGGITGLDESANYKRGEKILEPLEAYENYFDKETSKLYKARDEQAQNVPVQADNIMSVLKDESRNQANTDTIGLRNGAEARLKQLKIIDKDGNLLPTNAKTAENFRQYLNEQWEPKNSKFQKALKEAVDADVFNNAGENIYKDARALHELRKNTLDNPNGISAILEESGPNKINRKVDKEKIGQNIANMSVDQFSHIVDTLKGMPPELQSLAQQGLANIKSQFASKVSDLVSKPNALTKFMDANREVMPRLFSAEEMSNFRDLHNVSHMVKTDTGYPGAHVQKLNLEQKLGTQIGQQLLSKGAAGLAATGANLATAGTTFGLGETAAGLGANALVERQFAKSHAKQVETAQAKAFKNAQSRFVPLSDLLGNK